MLVAEEAVEIRVLSKQGKSIRDIARLLKVSRNTVNHQSILRGKLGPPRNCFGPTCVDCSSGGRRRP